MANMIEQKDPDERVHEPNPFKEIYTCKCGKTTGKDHEGERCSFCMELCQILPERQRNYKGWLHDQRNQTTRSLNTKEKQFYDNIFISINNNHETIRNINNSEFIMARLIEIITCCITDCRYINERVNDPEQFETDISDSFAAVNNYVDYIMQEVYYSWLGEKIRDTLYPPEIEQMVTEFTNIIATELIMYVRR